MTIARKLAMAVATFLLLIVATGGIALFQLGKVGNVADHIAEQELPSVRFAGAMRSEIIDFRNRETQLLIVRNQGEIDETLGRQRKNFEDLKKFEGEYEKIALREEQKTLLKDYRQAMDTYLNTHEQLVKMVRAGETEKAQAYFRGDQRKAFRTLLPAIDKIVEDSATHSDSLRAESIEVRKDARIQQIVCLLIAAAVGVAIGTFLYRSVVTPLEKVQDAIAHIVETKDFTHPIGITGHDEIAKTAGAVDHLISAMRTTLGDFSAVIKELSDLATKLASSAKHVEASSLEESDTASTMAATVEQMTVSINQVADNAQSLAEAAIDSDNAATEGRTVMLQTVEQMKSIGERIEDTSAAIQSLSVASDEITSIVQVIRDVADQTNLLALNAAIEAARAGEQGRGFAVVADEVRKLAEKSAKSAGEIDAVTSAIARQSVAVRDAIHQGLDHLASSREAVATVSTAIAAANASVEAVGHGMDDIAAATENQRQASEAVVAAIEAITHSARENSVAVETTAAAAGDMQSLASQLQQTVSRFRV